MTHDDPEQYMTAKEAAAALHVSRATLYAYVSRGMIRSGPIAGEARRRRYRVSDVRRLQERKAQRQNPALAAQQALHFGAPVLSSAITFIDGESFFYRGQDVLELARSRAVEEVAAFIWRGDWQPISLQVEASGPQQRLPISETPATTTPLTVLERFQCALPLAAAGDFAAYDFQPPAVVATGSRILALLTTTAAGVVLRDSLVTTLMDGWGVTLAGAGRLLSAALILCADHELNVSSFTARCVASAGSTPYQVVQAGLAALQGPRHGGHTARVTALLDEVDDPSRAQAVLGARLRRGEMIPGFGHPLYPDGDPRARFLLQLMDELAPEKLELARAVAAAAARLVGLQPTVDFALAAVARLLALPNDSPLTVFALGRTIGWIGHALEQYELDKIIRPRARYVGPLPESSQKAIVAP